MTKDMNRIDQLSLTASDSDIVQAIADTLMDVSRLPPYKLGVWHDAKAGPCALPVHSIVMAGKMCIVVYQNATDGRTWIVKALRMGYRVMRAVGRDYDLHSYSVADIRRDLDYRAKRASMTTAERQADDDLIPF